MVRSIQPHQARQRRPGAPLAAGQGGYLRGEFAGAKGGRGPRGRGVECEVGGDLRVVGVGVVDARGVVDCGVGLEGVGEGDYRDLGLLLVLFSFYVNGIGVVRTRSSHFGSRPSKGGRWEARSRPIVCSL